MAKKEFTPIQKANHLLARIRLDYLKKCKQLNQEPIADAICMGRTPLSHIETNKNTNWKNLLYVFGYYYIFLQEAPELIRAFHILADTQYISPGKWKELQNKKEADSPYDSLLLEKIRKAEQVDVNELIRKYTS